MNISNFMDLRPGDRVTMVSMPSRMLRYGMAQRQTCTGVVQPLGWNPAQGSVVLWVGGARGTTLVCTPANFLKAYRKGEKVASSTSRTKTQSGTKAKSRKGKRKVRSVWTISGGGFETNKKKH